MARGYFITGTDTDVGKTYVAQCLMRAFREQNYRTAGFKPVASGGRWSGDRLQNEDAELLMLQSNVKIPYELVNPYCFEPAIAPHIAAKNQNCVISLELIKSSYQQIARQSDVVIVEGAGGWKVPFNPYEGFDDVALSLATPIVLVVGLRLGCINHALLTEEAILNKGCRLVGWIGNSLEQRFVEKDENIDALKEAMKSPCIGLFDYHPNQEEEHVASQRNIESVLDYLLDFR
ncbi:MAG: dethiobiotin synthase [Cycloclasticus sp.]|nr:dethiobiotin synthase [Cycloclasticus sp.]